MTLPGAPGPVPGWAPAPMSVEVPGPTAPAPPPGPGVVPPFPAPPVEGRTARLWLGLGLGGLAVLLCCGAGTAAVIGLGVSATEALGEQARVQVSAYLDALQDEDYPLAYELLCDELQEEETRREFVARMSEQEPVSSYQLGELAPMAAELVVPAEVTYDGGREEELRFLLVQDTSTAQFEVCGTQE